MTIYRVYESYHYSDESGTLEFGYYTSLERAQARMNTVWEQRKYGERSVQYSSPTLIMGEGYDAPHICIEPIEIDVDTDRDCNGYT